MIEAIFALLGGFSLLLFLLWGMISISDYVASLNHERSEIRTQINHIKDDLNDLSGRVSALEKKKNEPKTKEK